MLAAAQQFKRNDCYQFDLVSIGTQVLANYASVVQQQFARDFKQKNITDFKQHTAEFMELIADMDQLMGTRRELLLGKWLNDAKKWGANTAESRLYEKNARDLITLWGGKDAVLHEYANKQWSGLFNGFYGKRWKMFISEASDALKTKKVFDQKGFTEKVKTWEWNWVNGTEQYPDQPTGDPTEISKKMYAKYGKQITAAYKKLKLTKNKK
ncbi:alpha-N-acetylglucosaminidase C-terminal domain-containing protein [Pedobacter panaciterrae]